MKIDHLDPEFVDIFPGVLEQGLLYISMKYAITSHLCASGCGNKVVLPLSPAEWKMYFDGEAVSITPSVGNWEYPCQAHYWISGNEIHWAAAWTKNQVENGRANDQRDLDRHFGGTDETAKGSSVRRPSFWTRLVKTVLRH